MSGAVEKINVLFGLAEFTYIALLVWIIFTGPGLLSLDRLEFGRWIAPKQAREDSARKPGEERAHAHASP